MKWERLKKKRGRGNNVQYLVKWLGYRNKFNSWVPASKIEFKLWIVMSRTHFYLMLPSNALLDVFPDNKTTGYHIQSPQNIDLEVEWEVGLYSVTYPNTWYTL